MALRSLMPVLRLAKMKATTLQEGVQLAAKIIESGKAMDKLDKLVAFTNQ